MINADDKWLETNKAVRMIRVFKEEINKAGLICLTMTICLFFGCAVKTVSPPVIDPRVPPPEIVEEESSRNTSIIMASNSLTKEGDRRIKKGDIEGAISILERAIGINSKDGAGYYYLAEAWLKKGNFKLAAQYNKLAGIYLRTDGRWGRLAEEQAHRINLAAGKTGTD
jgi:hypothetical protein